jgi:hypothetical protein
MSRRSGPTPVAGYSGKPLRSQNRLDPEMPACGLEVDEGLTGLDANAQGDVDLARSQPQTLRASLRGAQYSQGVVRVRRRRTEESEDSLADKLLDDAATFLDEGPQLWRGGAACARGLAPR